MSFRYACGRRQEFNGPTRHLRFRGTLFLIICMFAITAVSEQPNAQHPVVQALSSPKIQNLRTGNISGHRERVFYPRGA